MSLLIYYSFASGKVKRKRNKSFQVKELSHWKHQRSLGSELRFFGDDHNESTQDSNVALTLNNKSVYKNKDFSLQADFHIKYDFTDHNRSLLNIRNLFASKTFYIRSDRDETSYNEIDLFEDELGVRLGKKKSKKKVTVPDKSVEVSAGFQIHNWTKMHKFSPADTVNSHIFDGVWENPPKKGELTLSLKKTYKNTALTGLIFPRIEPAFIPKKHSQTSLGYNLEPPVWLKKNNNTSDDNSTIQASIRFEHNLKNFEYAIHYLKHINTDIALIAYDENSRTYTPNYFETTEVGFISQYQGQNYAFKLETVMLSYSEFNAITTVYGERGPQDHLVWAIGMERSTKARKKSSFNWLIEFQSVVGPQEEQSSEQYLYQSDLYLGLNHQFQNRKQSRLKLGLIVDLERDSEQVFELSFEQNHSKKIAYDLSMRLTDAPIKEEIPLNSELFHNTRYLAFNLNYKI